MGTIWLKRVKNGKFISNIYFLDFLHVLSK